MQKEPGDRHALRAGCPTALCLLLTRCLDLSGPERLSPVSFLGTQTDEEGQDRPQKSLCGR